MNINIFFILCYPLQKKFNDDEELMFRTEVLRIAQTIKQNQISSKTLQLPHTHTHCQYFPHIIQNIYTKHNLRIECTQITIHMCLHIFQVSIQHQTVLQHMNFQHNTSAQGSPNPFNSSKLCI